MVLVSNIHIQYDFVGDINARTRLYCIYTICFTLCNEVVLIIRIFPRVKSRHEQISSHLVSVQDSYVLGYRSSPLSGTLSRHKVQYVHRNSPPSAVRRPPDGWYSAGSNPKTEGGKRSQGIMMLQFALSTLFLFPFSPEQKRGTYIIIYPDARKMKGGEVSLFPSVERLPCGQPEP